MHWLTQYILPVDLVTEPTSTPCRSIFLQFKDVSREVDEFRVNTHLCKLRCWYLFTYYVGEFFLIGRGGSCSLV